MEILLKENSCVDIYVNLSISQNKKTKKKQKHKHNSSLNIYIITCCSTKIGKGLGNNYFALKGWFRLRNNV